MAKESEIIFYTTEDGNVRVEVFYQDETFWLTQKKLAELFGVQTHNKHTVSVDSDVSQNTHCR